MSRRSDRPGIGRCDRRAKRPSDDGSPTGVVEARGATSGRPRRGACPSGDGRGGGAVARTAGDRLGERELLGEALVEGDLDLGDAALEGVEPLVHDARGRADAGASPRPRRDRSARSRSIEVGQAVLTPLGRGPRFGSGELDLLLGDLGVRGERGELAADLRLDLCDAVVQFVDSTYDLGRGLVTEEVVDGGRVEGVGVVQSRVLPNISVLGRALTAVCGAPYVHRHISSGFLRQALDDVDLSAIFEIVLKIDSGVTKNCLRHRRVSHGALREKHLLRRSTKSGRNAITCRTRRTRVSPSSNSSSSSSSSASSPPSRCSRSVASPTRAKTSACDADEKTLQTALEAYYAKEGNVAGDAAPRPISSPQACWLAESGNYDIAAGAVVAYAGGECT